MEKVLFIYVDYDETDPTLIGGTVSHGLAALAGALKENNIQYSLLQITSAFSCRGLEKELSKYRDYNIIGLSFTTVKKNENYYIAKIIKSIDSTKYIVAGGVHPTVAPEEVINNENIDCVCVGEGETALPEIVKKYKTQKFDQIPNICFKVRKGREVHRNEYSINTEETLDCKPLPDYSIFNYKIMHCYKARIRYLPVMISRGCPFNCTYCSNFVINKITKQNIIKIYSPQKAISLIKENLKLANFLSVSFDDDILGIKKGWSEEFYSLYKKEINLPFKCYVRPEYVEEKVVSLMKDARCYRITFGVETGVESIRYRLNKKIKDVDFIRCFNLFKKYEIGVNTNNMIGLPYETFIDSLQTIKFNAKNNVDIPLRGIFTPFRYTTLYNYCKENNLIAKELGDAKSGFDKSILNLRKFSKDQIDFIMSSWNLLFLIYKRLYKLNNNTCIRLFDLFIISLRPVYPLLSFLRKNFFLGKLSTYLYKDLEKTMIWVDRFTAL